MSFEYHGRRIGTNAKVRQIQIFTAASIVVEDKTSPVVACERGRDLIGSAVHKVTPELTRFQGMSQAVRSVVQLEIGSVAQIHIRMTFAIIERSDRVNQGRWRLRSSRQRRRRRITSSATRPQLAG